MATTQCRLLGQPRIPVGSPFLKSLRRVATTAFARAHVPGLFSFVGVFFGHAEIVRFFCPNGVHNRVQTS